MSVAAAVLLFREGLEAALIVAIVLGYLRKLGQSERKGSVLAGVGLAVALTLGFSLALQLVGAAFDYPAKGIYEGITSLVAVAMLTYMVFWMTRQARTISSGFLPSWTAVSRTRCSSHSTSALPGTPKP